jgi:hypothetical protein
VSKAVGQREIASLLFDRRCVVEDERLKCFGQVPGVQVDQVVGALDEPFGDRGGNPFGGTAARIAGKAAIEVLPIERDDERRARPEPRQVD